MRVVEFFPFFDHIPDDAKFLFKKDIILNESDEEKNRRIISGDEINKPMFASLFYQIKDSDYDALVSSGFFKRDPTLVLNDWLKEVGR